MEEFTDNYTTVNYNDIFQEEYVDRTMVLCYILARVLAAIILAPLVYFTLFQEEYVDRTMVLCYILAGVLAAVIILYWSFEVHYFIRMGLTVFYARVFKRKVHILDSTAVTGVCLSTDVDTLLYHMNNARYLRELDFARVDFYERTDLYRTIRAKGGAVVQGACTIRYRRFVRPFSIYKITSKILYWDQNSIYMEHRFITPKDDFVRAIALCRQRLINISAEDVMTELLSGGAKAADPERGLEKPECPLEVLRWNESNEISSANLRNGC